MFTWRGVDHGREGLIPSGPFVAVIEVLALHEGEDLRDVASPVYRALQQRLPDYSWTGKNGDRPFFRDYSKPWVRMGAMLSNDDTDGVLTLTPVGRALANDPTGAVEFFRQYIDRYLEPWETDEGTELLSPFEVAAFVICQFDESQMPFTPDNVQARCEEIIASEHGMIRSEVFASTPTSRRRFRTYLTLLENAGAIVVASPTIALRDRPYLRSLQRDSRVAELTKAELTPEESAEAELSEEDLRRIVDSRVAVRDGQARFRAELMAAYEGSCCITGTSEPRVLEAAHISPYLGRHSNSVRNGLLMAVDIHRLFDRGLLQIDPLTLRVELDESVTDARYIGLAGVELKRPNDVAAQPSSAALSIRFMHHASQRKI